MNYVNPKPTNYGLYKLAEENGLALIVRVNKCARVGYLLGDWFYYKSSAEKSDYWKLERTLCLDWSQQ